ncbi:hypothetical protein GGI42DRAFT_248692 [Trichoderma sp. SZMC 28013]
MTKAQRKLIASQPTNAEGKMTLPCFAGGAKSGQQVGNEVYSRTGERQELQEGPGMGRAKRAGWALFMLVLFTCCKHVLVLARTAASLADARIYVVPFVGEGKVFGVCGSCGKLWCRDCCLRPGASCIREARSPPLRPLLSIISFLLNTQTNTDD